LARIAADFHGLKQIGDAFAQAYFSCKGNLWWPFSVLLRAECSAEFHF
jgi:hypothetical protein